jgi:hypothetical protein
MIWIDRLAIVWAAVLFFGLVLLESTVLSPADQFSGYFPRTAIIVLGLLAGVPWLLCRAIRWAFRRSSAVTYRVLP